jgi:hypothetical protein
VQPVSGMAERSVKAQADTRAEPVERDGEELDAGKSHGSASLSGRNGRRLASPLVCPGRAAAQRGVAGEAHPMVAFVRSSIRPVAALASAVVLATLAAAAPAVAAPPPYFIYTIDLGSPYLDGTGPINENNILLVLKDHDGVEKDRVRATTDGTGALDMVRSFNSFIDNGDTIVATDNVRSHARTFHIPRVGANISRVNNVVSGKGPANKSVDVSACHSTAFDSCTPLGPFSVPVDANGDWSYDFSPTNLIGGDGVDVVWNSAAGDVVRRELTTPFMALAFDGNLFYGTATRGSVVTMTLKDKNGQQRAKAQASAAPLFGSTIIFYGEWRKDAYPVNVRAGNSVTGSFATDAQMKIPAFSTTPNPATDRISGHCFNNAWFEVSARHNDGSDSAYYDGTTNASGSFNVDITTGNPTYNLRPNDQINLTCVNHHGDALGSSAFGILTLSRANRGQRR